MATVLKTPPFWSPLPYLKNTTLNPSKKKPLCLSTRIGPNQTPLIFLRFSTAPKALRFVPRGSKGEAETDQAVQDLELEDSLDGAAIGLEDSVGAEEEGGAAVSEKDADLEATPPSFVVASLQSYKEAIVSNDEARIAEIETFLKSIEDEKIELEARVGALTTELSVERDRVLRISADFDNFRKRTERERLSLVSNAQGEVVENLLPVLDNFERAKAQIKLETEGEEKINNSYQSIYKQFVEILGSLGVVPVETTGNPFDPLLHEAIMQGESTDFEEGIILDEYRKGFKLGDRLLRPAMVKVSSGPGPAKPEQDRSFEEGGEAKEIITESREDGSTEGDSA